MVCLVSVTLVLNPKLSKLKKVAKIPVALDLCFGGVVAEPCIHTNAQIFNHFSSQGVGSEWKK